MIDTIIIKKSTRKTKKYMAIVDGKKVHFGQKGASDFTKNKNDEQKRNYIGRHIKRERTYWTFDRKNLKKPSFWARYLLWNKKTLKESAKDIEKKFNDTIDVKT